MCQEFLQDDVHFARNLFQSKCQATTHVNWALLCAMPWLSAKKSMVRRLLEELTTTIGQLETENHQLQKILID